LKIHPEPEEAMKKQLLQVLWVSVLLALTFFSCNNGSDNGVTPPVNTLRIVSVTPSSLSLGAKSVPVVISGAGFSGTINVDLGVGIEVLNKTQENAQTLNLVVNVLPHTSPGPRTVIVTASGTSTSLDSGLTVSDNQAPVASFIVNPSQGTISSVFQFDASRSTDDDGTITSYKWEVSDGTNPSGKRFQKEFSEKGTYNVRLTVTDNKGGISSAAKNVEVGDNLPPVASFTVNPATGTQLTLYTFDASTSSDPDGEIRSYFWDFGDGTQNGKIVTHKFKDGGNFPVELQVKDSKGASSFERKTVKVVFFDRDKAIQEISDVLIDFLRQFDKFELIPAEDVVRGFSQAPGCTGRSHELAIVENDQNTIRSAGVDILGDPVVGYVDDQRATASIQARFFGTFDDGTDFDGEATHHMNMVHESDGWKICSFHVD
jgi:PKD repeat protein